jgi:hypothetical protein
MMLIFVSFNRPLPDFTQVFHPQKSTREPTVPRELFLNTEMRAEERSAFEAARKAREEVEEAMKERARREQEVIYIHLSFFLLI